MSEAQAWVIDGFGGAHPVGAVTRIGRSQDRDLVVLASSVSRDHADLRRNPTGWTLRDLDSRNGSSVSGRRAEGTMALGDLTVVKIGDVALWFIAALRHAPSSGAKATVDNREGQFVHYRVTRGEVELSVVTSDDLSATGALRWRLVGTQDWRERRLTVLEFQLLRALCRSAHHHASVPSEVRGCLPSKDLVTALPFQSKYANQENVRQVVLRLRTVLAEIGMTGVLAVAAGRGYYLAGRVEVVPAMPDGHETGS